MTDLFININGNYKSAYTNWRKPAFISVLLIITCSLSTGSAFAQGNAAARYEIDAKRIGVSPTSKDALPRSREFLRLDNTYYVGWMYEGLYKWDRSADYLGYKNAIPALRQAFVLIQKDFGSMFSHLFEPVNLTQPNFVRYGDLKQITIALRECYDNIEMPDSVMWVANSYDKFNFPIDEIGVNTIKAWTFHRNRFFTSAKYSFLRNSVAENEKMALTYCYKDLARIDYNEPNIQMFGPGLSNDLRMVTYHYLALLHCYLKNYDSSEYYYQKLVAGGRVSWNNYGGMQSEIGNFANAIEYFKKDQNKYFLAGMLREPYYYVPELYVYGGHTKEAIQMAQDAITQSGATPGFGWYNIALARGYLYDGQLDSCEVALNKAANFKELHIGTTLTQNQYEFTINLLRLQLDDRKIDQEKFLNQGWWHSFSSLGKLAHYKFDKMMAEYVVINELIFMPPEERSRTVYDLFCGEATTTFDEAWYLLRDFSSSYFTKKYEDYQKTDKRSNIQRYFKLFEARFKMQGGKEKEARQELEDMDATLLVDTANEKLFIARLYEALAKTYDDNGNKDKLLQYRNQLFDEYPQLVPFSGLKMEMKLNVSGDDDNVTHEVVSDLKGCNIKWLDDAGAYNPTASVSFNKRGDKYEAIITVTSPSGQVIVNNGRILFKSADGVGGEIALRLFGKGGALEYDPPPKQ
ncbi:MAG TPA: hypothetical protein VG738_03580 [Chitinophagaceae bacterium]|nr:hypothetical protein [Chitinophagaceae bacterium]